MSSLRTILDLGVSRSWTFHQMDVQNVFLYGVLYEEVYMKIPQGYLAKPHSPNLVYKLHKSIYDLKHASRTWFAKLQEVISILGFRQCKSDYPVFVCQDTQSTTIILAYIDNLLIIGDNIDHITQAKLRLQGYFAVKDLGPLKYFLGLEFSYHNNNAIFMSQHKYALDLLKYSNMQDYKPVTTPSAKPRMVTSIDDHVFA